MVAAVLKVVVVAEAVVVVHKLTKLFLTVTVLAVVAVVVDNHLAVLVV